MMQRVRLNQNISTFTRPACLCLRNTSKQDVAQYPDLVMVYMNSKSEATSNVLNSYTPKLALVCLFLRNTFQQNKAHKPDLMRVLYECND